jgi:uncharacterized membrane protein YqjE
MNYFRRILRLLWEVTCPYEIVGELSNPKQIVSAFHSHIFKARSKRLATDRQSLRPATKW